MALDLFGTDIACDADLSDVFAVVSGRRCLIEAVMHRLATERGSLIDDPSYGFDVRAWVNETMTPSRRFALEAGVANEASRDERVFSAQASVTFTDATSKLSIKLALVDAQGPFDFVLAVDSLTVELLALNYAT